MAWTAPRTWVSGELITATLFNQFIRDNQLAARPIANGGTGVATLTAGRVLIGNGTTSILDTGNCAVNGNLTISGSLSKGSGTFKIDHPLQPDTHHLVHSFIEGPRCDLLYRGTVQLDAGDARVNLDTASHMTEGTFEALSRHAQCFTTNETGWARVRGMIIGNKLRIESKNLTSADTVSWLVIAERRDAHILQTTETDHEGYLVVEPEKDHDG